LSGAAIVRDLMNAGSVVVNRQAAEPGLAVAETGGGVIDGAIACEEAWLGDGLFMLLDKQAVPRRPGRRTAQLPS
jgi:hypothetical protein